MAFGRGAFTGFRGRQSLPLPAPGTGPAQAPLGGVDKQRLTEMFPLYGGGGLSRLGAEAPSRPFAGSSLGALGEDGWRGGYRPTVRDISAQIAAGDLRRTIMNSLRGLI